MSPWDAVVVGAGPAGSAAAAALAGANRRVLVLEKDRFPRAKVCGQFLSGDALASLDRIGARRAVESSGAERIAEGSVHLPGGAAVEFRLPSPALGISRWRLDDLLAARAREAGAHVRFSVRVVAMSGSPESGFLLRLAPADAAEEEVRARTIVGGWGRWDALDKSLDRPFLRRRRYFGWSRDYAGDTRFLSGKVRLYLFRGGYCGLSLVEGGSANLAGVIAETSRRAIGGAWEDVVIHARRSNPALEADLAKLEPGPQGFLGTVPVVFTAKPPTEGGMLMAGDAAGVIDPFAGQGQAGALASGILAAETVLAFLEGRLSAGAFPAAYRTAWRRRFAGPFAWSAVLRRLMLDPALGNAAARIAGPALVRFGIRSLSRGAVS